MKRPLIGALIGVLLSGAALTGAGAASASATSRDAATAHSATPAVTVDFAGTVSLSNCSGSLIKMPTSAATDPAIVMSNGHCLSGGFLNPGESIVNVASSRSFGLLNSAGSRVATLRATKIAYATMTDTDISLYQLNTTYARIQSNYGIKPLELSATHPVAGNAIKVVSGYWKRIYSCNIDAFVYRLHEDSWIWKDSVRYTSSCNTIGGTSGSPVVDVAGGKVVAINNTGNENGERCTINNPCEVDQNGNVTVHQGINYAEETYLITQCVAAGNKIDLNLPGCTLPKPAALRP
ncbi:serine protease [Streptomyces sp. H10-C2]|uniref:S1 family peptidase n=1 Tax=unclassified Streptomyces TaxID=2593676 RepID=UPI0024BBB476|nr:MULTISPECIES: serine protease [unclassified Streptomyces]MDJ0341836.1 serine protease [Streptomyces sp. PH10-H1]MDJ0370410.1 serine protease [Streptomyces sp. H10-C2]